jgi:uncharacterized membrane protein HdeD (DUF308 family)
MSTQSLVGDASAWSIFWAIVLIVLGVLAIGSPLLAALAVVTLIAWLIVFAGADHLVYGFHAKSRGGVIWEVLVALAYVAIGIYLLAHRLLGVASLTLLLASLFLLEGVLNIIGYFQTRRRRGSAWLVVDGIITLLLGGLIWAHWPSSSLWAIGTLVGISMIISGVARVMMPLALRRLTATAA